MTSALNSGSANKSIVNNHAKAKRCIEDSAANLAAVTDASIFDKVQTAEATTVANFDQALQMASKNGIIYDTITGAKFLTEVNGNAGDVIAISRARNFTADGPVNIAQAEKIISALALV